MMMLIPEAWERNRGMNSDLREFYRYHAAAMEPWDGPATVAFQNNGIVGVATDRNGLRPARYQIARDGLVVCASEAGVLDLDPADLIESGQLGPGQVLAVDVARELLLRNDEAKRDGIVDATRYKGWRALSPPREDDPKHERHRENTNSNSELQFLMAVHGYTREELGTVLGPMAANGKEAVGSMGDDTPLSVLQEAPRPLYSYLRQRFAQVTNPPIDPIREANVMSMAARLGWRPPLIGSVTGAPQMALLGSPVLTDAGMDSVMALSGADLPLVELEALFDAGDPSDMRRSLDRLCVTAADAVDGGARVLVVSDAGASTDRAPVPMLLAASTLHNFLVRTGRRMKTGLVAAAGDARDVHHVACLVGCGADAVYPYLALRAVRNQVTKSSENGSSGSDPIESYVTALKAGLRKIMSKMGICTVASYTGGQAFEALGLAPEVVERSFPSMPSRIGGIDYDDIAADVLTRLRAAALQSDLDAGGWYKYRREGEHHAYGLPVWRALQKAATDPNSRDAGAPEAYQDYSEKSRGAPPPGCETCSPSIVPPTALHWKTSRRARRSRAASGRRPCRLGRWAWRRTGTWPRR